MRNTLMILLIFLLYDPANAHPDKQLGNPPPATTIIGFVLWENVSFNISEDLVVEPGAELTIKGVSTLKIKPGRRIIVKPGGKLIVDGAKITTACLEPWRGIEVWGDYTESQYPNQQGNMHQGIVIIQNGSIIENAIIGILAGRFETNRVRTDMDENHIPVNTGNNGGIIVAHSSEFRNNQVSIFLPPYENKDPKNQRINNNLSHIHNCRFHLTDTMLGELSRTTFIKLNGVRGIRIHGNRFENEVSIVDRSQYIGIESLNSSFDVGYLSGGNSISSFENLNYGIRALGTGSEKTFTVDSALFIRNITGIYTSMVDYFTVIKSEFETRNPLQQGEDIIHGGIYLHDESKDFIIEENIFKGSSEIPDNRTVGVAFNNTGEHTNELYNNTFQNLNYGVLAMHVNRSEDGRSGLCLKCNDFSLNNYDIAITYDDQLYTWGGIARNQGGPGSAPDAPAGNRFSWTGPTGTPTDINNHGDHIYYYYHANAPYQLKLKPEYVDTLKVTLVENYQATWNELSCPSNLTPPGGGHDEEELMGMMAEAEQEADSTQTLINLLKDAGDTQALHWDVSMSAPWQSMEVYSELMSVSPYVSDTVLDAAIEKENVLVDAMIRDVLVANPHSAKSETLMEKLDQRIQPLPGYMLDEILQGQSLVSVYENLQSSLSHHLQKHALYKKQLVQLYLYDTIQPSAATDSLVSLLLASNHQAHWYRAAFMRHEQGDSAASAAILSSIPASFSLSTEQLQSHSQLVSWLDQESMQHSQEKSLAVPDSAAVVWLFDIMENGDLPVSMYARNILLAHALVEYQPEYLLPDDTKSTLLKWPRSQSPPEEETLKLFPNPAREYVIVDFDLSKMKAMEGTGMLKISSMDGKLIEALPLTKPKDQLVFPLKGYQPGTYIFTLYYGNQMLDSKRLIIQ